MAEVVGASPDPAADGVYRVWAGMRSLDGGAGVDTLEFGSFQVGQPSIWDAATGSGGACQLRDPATGLTWWLDFSNIERLVGSPWADQLMGNAQLTFLSGGEGDDRIDGGDSFDNINGNQGGDTAHGWGGDDVVLGGKDDDRIFGDAGDDHLNGNLGADAVDGGEGDDTLHGGQSGDALAGGAGADLLSGDLGADTLAGGEGPDQFIVGPASSDAPSGGADRILDWSADDRIAGLYDPDGLRYHELSPIEGFGPLSYGEALSQANQLLLGGPAVDVIAVGLGADVVMFVDTNGDDTGGAFLGDPAQDDEADLAIILVGRSLADISAAQLGAVDSDPRNGFGAWDY